VDHREQYAAGKLDTAPTFPCYVKEGCGSFTLSSMHRVENATELNALLNTPADKLPDKARPPPTGFYAEWQAASLKKRRQMAQAAHRP
jgi:hypothetical protein